MHTGLLTGLNCPRVDETAGAPATRTEVSIRARCEETDVLGRLTCCAHLLLDI
jgi:hypothetical protein